MINKTIAIYVFIDDLLKKLVHNEPENRNMSDAEIITTVLVSAIYFSGHHEKAMSFMRSTGMVTHMLSKSRFNRRLHQVRELVVDLFFQLSSLIKELNISSEYSIDSFPIHTCDNIRISNSKLIQGEIYRGKKVSMRRYFYGYNVHILSTVDGIPVEYTFLPGSMHDSNALKQMPLLVAAGSTIYADSAYTNYFIEDMLKDAENIDLLVARKSTSKRKHEPYEEYLISTMRKRIETTFSEISNFFPKTIHAVNEYGFILKVVIFIFGYAILKTLL
jgi:Transposase DDE domain